MEMKSEFSHVNSEFQGKKDRILREKVTCFILFLFRGRSELPHNRDVSGQP